MAKITINKALVLRAALQDRANDLKKLLEETVSEKKRFFGGENSEITTPKYDPREVDTIITNIKTAVFEIDSATKESNAKVEIDLPGYVDFKTLIGNIGSTK